ncbi:hypothetical protein EB796_005471 [Bugula neritina]|uniref:Uncharacterized protein n=1 Tax=Bugula neritina TaxID=10212 RepID=A0A7J7KC61_BUGNE|nr:hypothetical protein EB796_005471 [Bugula neritina]
MIEEIEEAQQQNAECQEVQNLIIKGWPYKENRCSHSSASKVGCQKKATSHKNGSTSSELLMSWLLRATLLTMSENRVVHKPPNVAEKEQQINVKTMSNYKQQNKATLLPELFHGSPVHVRDTEKQGTVKTETAVIHQNKSLLVDLREVNPVLQKPNALPLVPMGAEVLGSKSIKKSTH